MGNCKPSVPMLRKKDIWNLLDQVKHRDSIAYWR